MDKHQSSKQQQQSQHPTSKNTESDKSSAPVYSAPRCIHQYQRNSKYDHHHNHNHQHNNNHQSTSSAMHRHYLSTSESSLPSLSSSSSSASAFSPVAKRHNHPELSPMSKRRNWKFYQRPVANPWEELKRNLYSDSRTSAIRRVGHGNQSGGGGGGGPLATVRPYGPYHNHHSTAEYKSHHRSSPISTSLHSTTGALGSSGNGSNGAKANGNSANLLDKFSKIKLSD